MNSSVKDVALAILSEMDSSVNVVAIAVLSETRWRRREYQRQPKYRSFPNSSSRTLTDEFISDKTGTNAEITRTLTNKFILDKRGTNAEIARTLTDEFISDKTGANAEIARTLTERAEEGRRGKSRDRRTGKRMRQGTREGTRRGRLRRSRVCRDLSGCKPSRPRRDILPVCSTLNATSCSMRLWKHCDSTLLFSRS